MTNEIRKLLERQAAWQKSLAALPWPEKVRMAEAVRECVAKFKRTGPPATDSDGTREAKRRARHAEH